MNEPKELEDYMTVNEMAQAANVEPDTIRKAIKRKRLVAKKRGRDWLATRQAFEAYQNNIKGKVGRPAKPKDT